MDLEDIEVNQSQKKIVENPESIQPEDAKEEEKQILEKEFPQVVPEQKPIWQWLREHLDDHPFLVDFKNEGTNFGVCYMLSNKVRGIRFNDDSILTLDESKGEVTYLRRNLQYERIV